MFSRKSNNPNTTYGDEPNTSTHNDPNASSYGSGNTEGSGRGPHKSSLLNKLDTRVDSSAGQSTSSSNRNDGGAFGTTSRRDDTGYGTSNVGHATSGYNTGYGSGMGQNTGSTNAGPHNSGLVNKVDPRVDSDMDRANTRMSRDSGYNTQHTSGYSNPTSNTGYGSSNTASGPHSSNLANKADPRVDSDNSRGNYGTNTGTYGSNTTGTGYGSPNTTTGPHNSNVANKADPRVDSDNSRGNYGTHTGNYGTNTTSTGYGNIGSTNTGPHNSNLANKVDPRVDSDMDGSNRHRHGQQYTDPSTGTTYDTSLGSHGDTTSNNTTTGPHKSNLMNKMDPRVDSDMDGSRNVGMNQKTGHSNAAAVPQEISSHGHATGGSPTDRHSKHGPHSSNLANKLDPRVDSNAPAGNVTNATANASVSGGMVPEGSASASGPLSADAGTTTSNQGNLRGAIRQGPHLMHEGGSGEVNRSAGDAFHGDGRTLGQGESTPRTRNY
jgi:hypothetical protein